MRVLIFGASGAIGRHVREQARASGHELVLFARDPSALEPLHQGESVFEGDIVESDRVTRAVAGVDAVISVLGPGSNSADQVTLFESFAGALVGAMQAAGVKRLVTISGAAVELPGERKPLRERLVSRFVRLVVRKVVDAKQREFDVIAASDLDWIAPRPPRVVAKPFTGAYRAGPSARGMSIGRADLAHFMVTQLTQDNYLRQAPHVAY